MTKYWQVEVEAYATHRLLVVVKAKNAKDAEKKVEDSEAAHFVAYDGGPDFEDAYCRDEPKPIPESELTADCMEYFEEAEQ